MGPGVARVGVRGACPSVHRPFDGVDGALLRVRLPGGTLSGAQLRACADQVGRDGGTLEITSRANLQLRGADRQTDRLEAVGLVDTAAGDGDGDSRRNVLVSPTAGVDPDEIVDLRGLGVEIAGLLAGYPGTVSPKFGVLLDGGGPIHLRGRAHDVCVGAVRVGGAVRLEVRLGQALPLRRAPDEPVILVAPEAVPSVVAAALELCGGARMGDVLGAVGRDVVQRAIARRSGGAIGASHLAPVRPAPVLAGTHRQTQAGRVWCAAAPVLGRLSGRDAGLVADIADAYGSGEVRLTPWRGVLVPHVAAADGPDAEAALAAAGLAADPADPVHAVVACAGSTGCPAGLTDTQGDGARLIALLRAAPERPPSVHLSGCAKSCARQDPAALTLVGTAGGRYDAYTRAPGRTGFGALIAADLSPDDALATARTATACTAIARTAIARTARWAE